MTQTSKITIFINVPEIPIHFIFHNSNDKAPREPGLLAIRWKDSLYQLFFVRIISFILQILLPMIFPKNPRYCHFLDFREVV